jgi:hypothetical protein
MMKDSSMQASYWLFGTRLSVLARNQIGAGAESSGSNA